MGQPRWLDADRLLVAGPAGDPYDGSRREPLSRRVSSPDPRRARPLPWADPTAIRFVVAAMPAALVLVALPAAMLFWATRRRSLRWALLGVAAVALAFAAARERWLETVVGEDLRAPQWRAAGLIGPAFARSLG